MSKTQIFLDAQERMLSRYGVEAKSWFVDVPSIAGRAHVLVSGEGPPALMLNGIGTPAAMFAPLMAELNELKIFAVDLPGYGLTDAPNHFTKNLKSNAVLFLKEVLDALELKFLPFIANSFGSLCTIWFSQNYPGRVSAMVHLGCPATVLDTSAPFPMRLLSVKILGRILTQVQPPSEIQVKQMSKMVKEYPLVPELQSLLLATELLPGYRKTFLSTLNSLIRLSGNRREMRITEEQLARIKQPNLIFWGKDDPFGTSMVGEKMVNIMPDAELHIIEGGHTPWLTQSKRIAPVVARFLSQLE